MTAAATTAATAPPEVVHAVANVGPLGRLGRFMSINAGWNESSGHVNGLVDRYLEEHELPPIAGQRS